MSGSEVEPIRKWSPHCMCIFKYKKGKDQNSDEFEINTAMLLYSVNNEKSDFKLEVLFMI